jgi:hypothetical protein
MRSVDLRLPAAVAVYSDSDYSEESAVDCELFHQAASRSHR